MFICETLSEPTWLPHFFHGIVEALCIDVKVLIIRLAILTFTCHLLLLLLIFYWLKRCCTWCQLFFFIFSFHLLRCSCPLLIFFGVNVVFTVQTTTKGRTGASMFLAGASGETGIWFEIVDSFFSDQELKQKQCVLTPI